MRWKFLPYEGILQSCPDFKEMAQEHGVSDKINIKASFCMKNCVNGISTSVDGQLISGVNISNAPDRFLEFILPKAVSDNS